MKTSRLFLIGSALLAHCCFLNAQSTNGIAITFARSNLLFGEAMTIAWSMGTNIVGPDDWVSLYRTDTADPAPPRTAVAGVRASTSSRQWTYTFATPGSYHVRYIRPSPTNTLIPSIYRSQVITVTGATSPVMTVSTNRIRVREAVTVRWTPGTNVIGPNDWVSFYRTDVPDPAPPKTASGGVRASTSGREVTVLFTVSGTYEVRYVRTSSTNTLIPSLARGPIITVVDPVENPSAIHNYPSSGQNIIAFGDSLVQGVGSTPDEDMVSEMVRRLCCRPILNKGVIGNTTAQALARLQSDVLSQNPKIVIIVLGGNDFIQGIPPETTYNNLKEIITRIHSAGAIVVLVGIEAGRFTASFAPNYRRLADETGCAYIPNVLQNVWGNSRLMASIFDVHPNSEGYEIMAKRIAPSVGLLDAGVAPAPFAAAQAAARTIELSWSLSSGTECILESGMTATFTDASPILSVKRVGDNLVIGINPTANQAFFKLDRVPTQEVIGEASPENPEASPEDPPVVDGDTP